MLSSINFLFLASLAISSWVILCYFKQIEDQRLQAINVEYTLERSFEDTLKPSCHDHYDIYFNCLSIFVCVYALAKITQITENYIARQVHERLAHIDLLSAMKEVHVAAAAAAAAAAASNDNDNDCMSPPPAQSPSAPPNAPTDSPLDLSTAPPPPEPVGEVDEQHLREQVLSLKVSYLERQNSQLERELKHLQRQTVLLLGNVSFAVHGMNGGVTMQPASASAPMPTLSLSLAALSLSNTALLPPSHASVAQQRAPAAHHPAPVGQLWRQRSSLSARLYERPAWAQPSTKPRALSAPPSQPALAANHHHHRHFHIKRRLSVNEGNVRCPPRAGHFADLAELFGRVRHPQARVPADGGAQKGSTLYSAYDQSQHYEPKAPKRNE